MASQPSPIGTHRLNIAKGHEIFNALDASYTISANVLYDLQPGQVCHQNSSGQLEPGVIANQMGFFLFGGAASLDVLNSSGTYWWPINPSGRVACFPAKAPLEMWTTEFDSTQTYAPNDPLRAPVGNAADGYTNAKSGQLTNQGVLTWVDYVANNANKPTAICGVAIMASNPAILAGAAAPTTPKFTNVDGTSCLSFYPVYQVGHPTQTV